MVISVYGLDSFGNDVIRGYGVCHIPITSGITVKKYVMLYVYTHLLGEYKVKIIQLFVCLHDFSFVEILNKNFKK